MNWSTRSAATLALVALVTLAGCASLVTDETDPAAIAEQVQDRHEQVDDLHGVQTISYGDEEVTSELWIQPPDKQRQEVVSAGSTGTEGDVTVTNGSTSWYYDSQNDRVTRMNVSGNVAGSDVVTADQIERMLEEFEVEHEGSDTVADREAEVLSLTSTEDDDDALSAYDDARVWIDTEYWYPLKYEVTTDIGNESETITMAFEEVEFNAGVDAERFEFEPPEDAEVREPGTGSSSITEVDSLAEADEETDVGVGEPAVPDRFDRDSVRVLETGEEPSVTAMYTSDDGLLAYEVNGHSNSADGETVQVGDAEGVLTDESEFTTLHVECDGVSHAVLSDDASEDELVDALAALECT